jgi:hypothetical protein
MNVRELKDYLEHMPDELEVASPNIGSLVAIDRQETISFKEGETPIYPGIIWMHFGRKP